MNLFQNILNKTQTWVNYLATGQAWSDLYDWANPEQQDPIQRFLDDPAQDMSKKQALMDNLKNGVPAEVMKSYVTEKYYKPVEFKQTVQNISPTFEYTGKENPIMGAFKTVWNIPSNLYNIGASGVNLASTAYQEGIPETAWMIGRGIVKSAWQWAQNVATSYQNEWLLGASNTVLGGVNKYLMENPLDVVWAPAVGSLAKQWVKSGAKSIVKTAENVAPKIVQWAKFATDITTAPVKSIINTARKYVSTPEEISGIQSAIKPKQRVKNGVLQRSQDAINKEITLTNSLIRQSGVKPTDLATYKTAIKWEMEKIGSEINRLTGQDLTIDITPSTAKLRQLANSDIVKTLDPADTNALLGLADRLDANGGRMSLSMAEEMNQWLNSVLKDTTVPKSEAYKRGLMTLVEDIRNGLDDSISNIPWQFKEIKKAYWALRNVYGDTVAREIVFNRQNMGGLVDSIGAIEWAGNIVGWGGKILMGDIRWWVSDIGKGIASNAMGRFIRSKNDPNNIIRSIFEKDWNKSILPNIPNKPTNGNIPRSSTNSSPILDMGTTKKVEWQVVKPTKAKPIVKQSPQVKPVEKTVKPKNLTESKQSAIIGDMETKKLIEEKGNFVKEVYNYTDPDIKNIFIWTGLWKYSPEVQRKFLSKIDSLSKEQIKRFDTDIWEYLLKTMEEEISKPSIAIKKPETIVIKKNKADKIWDLVEKFYAKESESLKMARPEYAQKSLAETRKNIEKVKEYFRKNKSIPEPTLWWQLYPKTFWNKWLFFVRSPNAKNGVYMTLDQIINRIEE